jgi:hybrid cluster-associated redox disulfide protein
MKNSKLKTQNTKGKTGQYITENTLMAEIVEKYPEVVETLTEDYGFHCFGCFASEFETLGQGAGVHGMNKEEMLELLETLNGLVSESRK